MPELDLVTNIYPLHSAAFVCDIAQLVPGLLCGAAKGQRNSFQMHKLACLFSMRCSGLLVVPISPDVEFPLGYQCLSLCPVGP